MLDVYGRKTKQQNKLLRKILDLAFDVFKSKLDCFSGV